MTTHRTLTLAGLQHTTVVLKDRHEARKLLGDAEYVRRKWGREWHLYGAGGYLGCVSYRVEREDE